MQVGTENEKTPLLHLDPDQGSGKFNNKKVPHADETWLSSSHPGVRHPEVHHPSRGQPESDPSHPNHPARPSGVSTGSKARTRGYFSCSCGWCPRGVQQRAVVLCVLFVELIERMTYYSISGNMVLFCTNVLLFSSTTAVTINLVFSGTCYFLPVVGGWISDSFLGRFNTILGFALLYVVGTTILPAISFDYSAAYGNKYDLSSSARQGFYLLSLALIAVGTGGIKANIGPFGAQQLEDRGFDTPAVQSYWNWFYFFINVGSFISFSAVVYVQQEIGFTPGYIIPASCMVLAIVIFIGAKRGYTHHPPTGSVVTKVCKIVWAGIQGKRNGLYALPSFLDHAKVSNGGDFSDTDVEDVKTFGKVMPVFFSTVGFCAVYSQMSNSFLLQAERMDLSLGGFTIPAASLQLFDSAVIIVLVPLMDRLVFPLLDRCNLRPTLLKKMGIGMVLACVSVVLAGFLEMYRKREIGDSGGFPQEVGGKMFQASHYSILYQIPQFMFIGAGEVFTIITTYDFAYTQAPTSLEGVVMGMSLISMGLGSYVASALVSIVNVATAPDMWFPDEINDGHLDWFFFLLGGLLLLNLFCVFLPISLRYRYVPNVSGFSKRRDPPSLPPELQPSPEKSPPEHR